MARNRGKKALYEVMSKTRLKPVPGRTVEQMHPKKTDEDKPTANQRSAVEIPKAAAKWWRKPRIIQFNAGRIEFSMPYQIGIALLLILILLFLAAYRLGQSSYPTGQQGAPDSAQETLKNDEEKLKEATMTNLMRSSEQAKKTSLKTKEAEPLKSTGNNVIVLVEFERMADLVPVKTHFAENGIETVIDKENGRYFLQTKQRYDNPATPGTDGYKAIQKIIEVGAKYKGKAPAGYESFAKNLFSDAYGKKVE